jgi:hypothetical protein
MVNFVNGPIVAVMGTAEGVIVKARELVEAALGRGATEEVDDEVEGDDAPEDDAEAATVRMPAPADDGRNGQIPTGV